MRIKNHPGIWIPLVLLLAGCLLGNCGKKPEEQEGQEPAAQEEQPAGEEAAGEEEGAETAEAGEAAPVAEDDVVESDEDLLSVDYSQFYDDLAPHGKWIEVSAKDLGLDSGKKSAAFAPAPGGKPSFWDRVSLIKSAHAQTKATASASASASASADFSFYVWVPSPELYVSAEAEAEAEAEASYTPYSNGQWIYTDAGWYFKAATPAEEITSHYGRWTLSGSLGWVWVPGRVWAPAWVAWREDDNYVAWTPVPPKVYLSGEVLVAPDIEDENLYVIVEKKHFLEPAVFKYRFMYKVAAEPVSIKVMTKRDGIMIKEKRLINWGPNIVHIQAKTGKKITVATVHRVGAAGQVKYLDGEIHVYAPKLSRVKVKVKAKAGAEVAAKGAVSAPKVSVKYKVAKKAMKSGKLFVDVKGEAGADVKVKVKGDDVKVKVKDQAKAKVDAKTKGGVDVKAKGAGADAKVKTGGKGGVSVDLKGGAKVETGAKAGASAGASTGGKKKKK